MLFGICFHSYFCMTSTTFKIESIYFDSYGFIAPENIHETITPYEYNDGQIQDMNSSACGYFCISFIKFLHKINL